MSTSSSSSDRTVRQPARRVFAEEFNQATSMYTDGDGERAPRCALLPTGEGANRVYVVGTLTETQDVGTDNEYWQGRVVDPTGTVFVYAGQYQPEAATMLRTTEPPAYVAVVGKPRTFDTGEGQMVSIRPESITVVDATTRDRWVVEAAEHTLERIEAFDPDKGLASRAHEEYEDLDLDEFRAMIRETITEHDGGD